MEFLNLKERLREYINDNYKSIREFCRINNISSQYLNQYLNGYRNITVEFIQKLVKMGFNEKWLINNIGEPAYDEEKEKMADEFIKALEESGGIKKIPEPNKNDSYDEEFESKYNLPSLKNNYAKLNSIDKSLWAHFFHTTTISLKSSKVTNVKKYILSINENFEVDKLLALSDLILSCYNKGIEKLDYIKFNLSDIEKPILINIFSYFIYLTICEEQIKTECLINLSYKLPKNSEYFINKLDEIDFERFRVSKSEREEIEKFVKKILD